MGKWRQKGCLPQSGDAIPGEGCGVCGANLACVQRHMPRFHSIIQLKNICLYQQEEVVMMTAQSWHSSRFSLIGWGLIRCNSLMSANGVTTAFPSQGRGGWRQAFWEERWPKDSLPGGTGGCPRAFQKQLLFVSSSHSLILIWILGKLVFLLHPTDWNLITSYWKVNSLVNKMNFRRSVLFVIHVKKFLFFS